MVSSRFFCLNLLSIVVFLCTSSIGVDATPEECFVGSLVALGCFTAQGLRRPPPRSPPPSPSPSPRGFMEVPLVPVLSRDDDGEMVVVPMPVPPVLREFLARQTRYLEGPFRPGSNEPVMPYAGKGYRLISESEAENQPKAENPVHIPEDKENGVGAKLEPTEEDGAEAN